MKNKRKSILTILIIFSAILGFSYYTNAAENLKALQDKYRISYNNLTKALKDGADQECIDQLSEQCKADYAEYQKALHPASDFTGKPGTAPQKPSKGVKTPILTEQKTLKNAKKQNNDKVTFPKFINKFSKNSINVKEEVKRMEVIEKSQKQAPIKIAKNNGPIKISRIREKLADVTPITDFPELTPDTNDTLEIEGINNVKELFGLSDWCNTGTWTERLQKILIIESILPEFCQIYAKYPYICAMGKFCFAEFRHRFWGDSETTLDIDGFRNQEIYTQLSETYANEKGSKADVFSKIKEISDARVSAIGDVVNSLDSQIQALNIQLQDYLKFFNALKNATTIDYMIHNGNTNKPSYFRINGQSFDPSYTSSIHIAISGLYSQIATLYLKMRNFDKADAMMQESIKFHNEIPASIKEQIYYIQADGTETPGIEYTNVLTRNTDYYLDSLKNYMKWSACNGEVAENSEIASNKVQELIKTVTDYQWNKDRDNITEEQLATIKANITDKYSDGTHDNYYANKPNITKIYFTRFENVELLSDDVTNPFETLSLRALIDENNPAPFYSVPNVKISTINDPEHVKILILKRDWICGGYCRTFQVNSDHQPPDVPSGPVAMVKTINKQVYPVRNLVNRTKDAEKESISVLSGYNGYEDGLPLYDKQNFWKVKLARATWKGQDFPNNVVDVSKAFCIEGGEAICASVKTLTGYVVVANQADWFMIEADGKSTDGHVEFVNSKGAIYQVFPKELEGKYDEDIDVLILDACWCLEYSIPSHSNAERWQKVLPKGLILGFNHRVYPKDTKVVFEDFSGNIKSGMSPKDLGDLYLDTGKNKLNNDTMYLQWGSGTYEFVAYILDHQFGYLEEVNFQSVYGLSVDAYIRKYKSI